MGTIDYKNVLIEKLKTGVNLFTGAGFSVLPAPNGISQYLVTAKNWLEMALDENNNSRSIRNCLKRINIAINNIESQEVQNDNH